MCYTYCMISDYDYPLLSKITESFSRISSTDIHICACQHILEPQEKMFDLISGFGIPKENIHILGKTYSTNLEVLGELQRSGFKAEQPTFDFSRPFDEQHKENCQKLFESFSKTIKNEDRVIVMDDGAELLNVFNANLNFISPKAIIGIEQTSSGFRKLEKEAPKFPVINVARSAIKLNKESPLIARLGCDRINHVIKKYNIPDPKILVVGLGPMGNNTLLILKEEGYSVIGHDTTFDSKSEISDLIIENNINVLVGVTGSNILTEEQIKELDNRISATLYLISMSSSDREFPAAFLRQSQVGKDIYGDVKWNNMVLINNGFPITFKGKRYESTPIEIERTIALLYGSVLYAASVKEIPSPGLMDVPQEIEGIINSNESN